MINLTTTYPSQQFLSVAQSQIISQVDAINASGIPNRRFPLKFGRINGTAPDNSGSPATQIDVLISGSATYGFQNLNDARNYALQAGNEVVNNSDFYVENVQPGYYQAVIWGPA